MKASELKIGDTIKRQGIRLTVVSIENDTQKNGTPCLAVSFTANDSKKVDTFLNFKLDTKVS